MIRSVSRGLTAMTLAAAVAATTMGTAFAGPSMQPELDAVHEAGIPGVHAQVRDGAEKWGGAAGVADLETNRPMEPHMRHRVGSITKTFVATALLQQVGKGTVGLHDPIAKHVPELVPGELGQQVTVRMLLNHTSGIGDYFGALYPSVAEGSLEDVEANRYRSWSPQELVAIGLDQPRTGEPGERYSYSNTGYIIAGEILGKVSGVPAEQYVTDNVIRPLGLRNTYFPGEAPTIAGPHGKAYDPLYGIPEQQGEFSVYNMTMAGTAGALVSTPADLNVFYRELLAGGLLAPELLAEMKDGVPVLDENGNEYARYGLGIMGVDGQGCGWVWGHSGGVHGMETMSLHTEDASRQISFGTNIRHYQELGEDGRPKPHPADDAIMHLSVQGVCPESPEAARILPKIQHSGL